MKKLLLILGAFCITMASYAQTVTLISPEGLSEPYEVAPGTEVTIKFDSGWQPATLFSFGEEPVLDPFFPNGSWTQSTTSVDNGDGTYNFTITVDEPTWAWGGFYQMFFSQWAYSNVIEIGIASSVVIDFEDGLVCADGTGTEILTVQDPYDSYQWYMNGDMIDGATSQTYSATEPGNYKVQCPVDGTPTFSNALNVNPVVIELDGSYDDMNNEITMSGTEGFDSYQWLSGPDEANLTSISEATEQMYTTAITDTETYYAVQGTLDGCVVTTAANPVSNAIFEIPQIVLSADSNEFGNVCSGQEITLSIPDIYSEYQWFRGASDAYNSTASYTFSQYYYAGDYHVIVSPMGWPNIQLQSEIVNADFFIVEEPQLQTGTQGPFCPGSTVTVVLSDEGYNYTWYVHSGFTYTEEDLVEVPGVSIDIDFQEGTYVTVVAENGGCTSSDYINLNSAGNQNIFLQLPDYEAGKYLCADSTILIQVPSFSVDNYSSFQWYSVDGEDYTEIDGATESFYEASEIGTYVVRGEFAACPGLMIESNSKDIVSFLDRELSIYAYPAQICIGDTAELIISSSNQWENIQWFDLNIQLGSTAGYEKVDQVIIDAGSDLTYEVTEFNTYFVKGRHISCPTGPKLESNHVELKPSVNPDITVDPEYEIYLWHLANFDSIPGYIYCTDQPVSLQVPDTYDSYEWYYQEYSGDDNYVLGDQLVDFSGNTADVIADYAFWITALVEEEGCLGMSDPILIDTWQFNAPAIASYNNSEICMNGDSALINIAFPGDYEYIEWLHEGELIPNENNDSLYVSETGEYIVVVYQSLCPDFGETSGAGPNITILEDEVEIFEEEDLIYAFPFQGFYEFQWYLDGEPIASPEATPWLLYKDEMESGVYTVDVTNPEPCTILSAPFDWIVDGVEDISKSNFSIYPNPASDYIQIVGADLNEIAEVSIHDITGKTVFNSIPNAKIEISSLERGAYILLLRMNDGNVFSQKWIKN